MCAATADPISDNSLRLLHPTSIPDKPKIAAIIGAIQRDAAQLRRGTNRAGDDELAWIAETQQETILLRTEHFRLVAPGSSVFLTCHVSGLPFFFTVPAYRQTHDQLLVGWPVVIYQSERRDRPRKLPELSERVLSVQGTSGSILPALVADESPGGLGVVVSASHDLTVGEAVRIVRPKAGDGALLHAEIRSDLPVASNRRARRLGLALLPEPRRGWVSVDVFQPKSADILPRVTAPESPLPRLNETSEFRTFWNGKNQDIRAIVTRVGQARGAPAVVIPPAWGKTKETLLPLALTIQETFSNQREPVTIVRFDGVRKRGESYNDPDCRDPELQNLHYTFSQGVDDILALLEAFESDPEIKASRVILVSFSVASIEARRAVVLDAGERVGGWISVVGAVDPQSLIRVVSGGIDYIAGAERGIQFGNQHVQGLLLDVDRAGRDAIASGLGFIEDARRDFSLIRVPVTWIHGRHDGWSNLDRVRDVLSCGDSTNRRILEAPTGHQLRDSDEAMEVFRVVAAEVARLAVGRSVPACSPTPERLRECRRREVGHRRAGRGDLRVFWERYLVGAGHELAMELVAETAIYRELMRASTEALDLMPGQRIADLGCGVGTFLKEALNHSQSLERSYIVEVDFVAKALRRARQIAVPQGCAVGFAVADLDRLGDARDLPFRSETFDRALSSLVLNYLADPREFLERVFRLLRPEGRLVLTCLRRDADVSLICTKGVTELRSGLGRQAFGDNERTLDRSLADFINSAGKLLDLEERGIFRFWDSDEVRRLVRSAGFENVSVSPVFGDPPQAHLVTADKPRGRGVGA